EGPDGGIRPTRDHSALSGCGPYQADVQVPGTPFPPDRCEGARSAGAARIIKRRSIAVSTFQKCRKDLMSTRREFVKTAMLGGMAADLAKPDPQAKPIDPGRKLRMAVVGGGFGSGFYWHEHPRCVVTAVTDLYAVRRNKLRDAYRCDNVYDSLEDMLKKRNDLDAIAIFSDAPSHVKHVRMCMEHGLHVVSAVPACMSLEDAEKLREIKERTGLHYMMAESSYYRQPAIYARDLFKKGGFGEIFYTECEYYHDFNFDER